MVTKAFVVLMLFEDNMSAGGATPFREDMQTLHGGVINKGRNCQVKFDLFFVFDIFQQGKERQNIAKHQRTLHQNLDRVLRHVSGITLCIDRVHGRLPAEKMQQSELRRKLDEARVGGYA